MVCSKPSLPSWATAATWSLNSGGNISSLSSDSSKESSSSSCPQHHHSKSFSGFELGFGERAFSAAGAAFLSAVLVNPLDVAKTRLQAQAAQSPHSLFWDHVCSRMASFEPKEMFSDLRCSPSCTRAGVLGTLAVCPPDCFQYKGTLDVFYKIIQQEGLARLWRGTNAGLALAVPTVGIYLPCYDIFRNWIEEFTNRDAPYLTPYIPLVAGSVARSLACITCYPIELARTRMQAFKEVQAGMKPPGVWKTLVGILSPLRNTFVLRKPQSYGILWTGVGAQLARDVPFSAICWSALEPVRRRILSLVDEEPSAVTVLGANFSAGFVAGSLAAAATCPLDVAKTRRQIEKDPARAFNMTTARALMEVWRGSGMKGLFTGFGPRVARAGPSVGIVVSFYEVVKYVFHQRHSTGR